MWPQSRWWWGWQAVGLVANHRCLWCHQQPHLTVELVQECVQWCIAVTVVAAVVPARIKTKSLVWISRKCLKMTPKLSWKEWLKCKKQVVGHAQWWVRNSLIPLTRKWNLDGTANTSQDGRSYWTTRADSAPGSSCQRGSWWRDCRTPWNIRSSTLMTLRNSEINPSPDSTFTLINTKKRLINYLKKGNISKH